MKQKYTIELVEEHDAVNFYSIHLDEEELSELERFFEKFPVGCEYDDEIDIIVEDMRTSKQTGDKKANSHKDTKVKKG